MKFEDLNVGDVFRLPGYAGFGIYMKIPNLLKDDENKFQKNAVVLYGIYRGDVTRFSESQGVLCLDKMGAKEWSL